MRIRRSVAAIAGLTAGATLVQVPAALADEADQVVAEAGELSRQASATNERVLDIENQIAETNGQIQDTQDRINESQAAVDESNKNIADAEYKLNQVQEQASFAEQYAAEARASQQAVQQVVNDVAGSHYRGATIDPLTNVMHADGPQQAIDRSAYMDTLSRKSVARLEAAQQANREAAAKASAANQAVAEANYARAELDANHARLEEAHKALEDNMAGLEQHLADLNAQHTQLEAERSSLSAQSQQLQNMVQNFSASAQQQWVNQYGANKVHPAPSSTGNGVVDSAMSRIGSPYAWGATGPNAFDCSGLMLWSYQQNGKSIPRTSQAQISGGTPVSKADLQPGDIVGFYPGVTHVGMYIGNGQIVHASDYGIPVQVASLDSMPFAGAARY